MRHDTRDPGTAGRAAGGRQGAGAVVALLVQLVAAHRFGGVKHMDDLDGIGGHVIVASAGEQRRRHSVSGAARRRDGVDAAGAACRRRGEGQ